MARLYRHGLYRPDRHGIFAFSGGRGGDEEAFLWKVSDSSVVRYSFPTLPTSQYDERNGNFSTARPAVPLRSTHEPFTWLGPQMWSRMEQLGEGCSTKRSATRKGFGRFRFCGPGPLTQAQDGVDECNGDITPTENPFVFSFS
jgi:hypothetical protein